MFFFNKTFVFNCEHDGRVFPLNWFDGFVSRTHCNALVYICNLLIYIGSRTLSTGTARDHIVMYFTEGGIVYLPLSRYFNAKRADIPGTKASDKKAMEYMKDRYEGKKEPQGPKIIREPKKLDVQWGK